MEEKRLIWTVRGNLDLDSLDHKVQWESAPDYVKFIETYTFDGEVVKQSAHVLSRQSLVSESTIEVKNG